jgi:hypothetical protein
MTLSSAIKQLLGSCQRVSVLVQNDHIVARHVREHAVEKYQHSAYRTKYIADGYVPGNRIYLLTMDENRLYGEARISIKPKQMSTPIS